MSLNRNDRTTNVERFTPQYFNHINIEDSRVYELTNKAGLLSPYQILHECLKRWVENIATTQAVPSIVLN